MKLASLQDLYVEELRDLYSAETQILKALPKMAEAASSADLKMAFNEHLEQSRNQVSRLEQIFLKMGEDPKGKACKGMRGLLEEGDEAMKEDASPAVMDACLISMAQRVEHYEIAGYGTLCTFAEQLGDKEGAQLLKETLNEEEHADKKLSQLAEQHINRKAQSQR